VKKIPFVAAALALAVFPAFGQNVKITREQRPAGVSM